MDWGMKNRLSKIIKPKDGHTVMLAVDHGYFMGPTTGLEKLDEMVKPLLPYADVLMPTACLVQMADQQEWKKPQQKHSDELHPLLTLQFLHGADLPH